MRSPSRPALLASVLVALSLHGTVLTLFVRVARTQDRAPAAAGATIVAGAGLAGPRTGRAVAVQTTAVEVLPVAARTAPPEMAPGLSSASPRSSSPPSSSPPTKTAAPIEVSASAPAPAPAIRSPNRRLSRQEALPAATRSSAPSPAEEAEEPASRFYRSSEVERRAEPDSDWNLDAAALDTARIGKLVFDVYIDRDGRIVACDIREPADLPAPVREQLAARIAETPMRPAERRGSPVPNVQRIEMSVGPPGP